MPVPVESLRGAVRLEDSTLAFEVVLKTEAPGERLLLVEGELVFETVEPPVRGRPEAALKRFLARALKVNPGMVEIEAPRGAERRLVRVSLGGGDPEEALARLAEAVEPGV